MPMVKTLIRHGNSLALIIDKPILDLLHITADTPLEITTDGASLRIQPACEVQTEATFEAAVENMHRKFGDAMKRLAE